MSKKTNRMKKVLLILMRFDYADSKNMSKQINTPWGIIIPQVELLIFIVLLDLFKYLSTFIFLFFGFIQFRFRI